MNEIPQVKNIEEVDWVCRLLGWGISCENYPDLLDDICFDIYVYDGHDEHLNTVRLDTTHYGIDALNDTIKQQWDKLSNKERATITAICMEDDKTNKDEQNKCPIAP